MKLKYPDLDEQNIFQENFEKISRIIKKEFEAFDVKKCKDFKETITKYLENMLKYNFCQKDSKLAKKYFFQVPGISGDSLGEVFARN